MELRERVYQSADWCDAHSDLHERIKHIGRDLRDAMSEIEAFSSSDSANAADARRLRVQVRDLEEQLLMARTEAKDVAEFREREQHEYKHVLIGLRLAIQSMMSGLKGGDK